MVTDGMIHHSYQGHQYTPHRYHGLSQQYNITPSMLKKGNDCDNASMENFFGHIKKRNLSEIFNYLLFRR
jgi:transposase InsO family protein